MRMGEVKVGMGLQVIVIRLGDGLGSGMEECRGGIWRVLFVLSVQAGFYVSRKIDHVSL